MTIRFFLAFVLLMTLSVLADDGYVRLVRDEAGKPTALQTAIARFEADKTTVDLVGVIHVADKAYYQRLDRHFNNYQSVLYEMVLDVPRSVAHQNDVRELLGREPEEPRIDTRKGGRDSLSRFQRKLAEVLGLEYQLSSIDYSRSNFHHADLTLQEFQEAMAGKEKSPVELLKELLEVGKFKGPPEYERLSELPLLRILTQGPKPDEQRILKVGLGALLADEEDLGLGLQGEVVIGKRNERALEVLKKRMKKGETEFAIFYGAAHMSDFSARLRGLGFTPVARNWVNAWEL